MPDGSDALPVAMDTTALIPRRLAEHVGALPNATAFRFIKRGNGPPAEITWGELWADAAETADRLDALDLAGQRIAIGCDDPLDFVVALVSCLISGSAAVPLPVSLSRRSAPRAAAILAAAAPAAALTAHGSPVEDWLAGPLAANLVVHVARGSTATSSVERTAVGGTTVALIQFTSGSTGDPRGIALTHGNIAANCAAIVEAYGLSHASRGLSWLPLHHDMGLIGHVMTPLWLGCLSAIMDPLTFLQRPLEWLRLVSRERASITSAPNFAYEAASRAAESEDLADMDLSSLTAAVCGGEPVLPATVERFLRAFGKAGFDPGAFAPSYGLAEATLLVASGRRSDGPRFVSLSLPSAGVEARTTDLGSPVAGTTVRVVDDVGRAVADGAIGEIEISGASVGCPLDLSGRPAALNAVKTGDLGCLKDGRLLVTGRKKDIIILRGQNVHPSDVEAAATAAHAAIAPGGVAAVGIDLEGTEALAVMVEIDRKAQMSVEALVAIRRSVSEHVGKMVGHVPAVVVVLRFGSLPRTSSGKIRRGEARRLFSEGRLPVVEGHRSIERADG